MTVRISELVELSTDLSQSDVLPIVDISAAETKQVTVANLLAVGISGSPSSFIDLAKLNQASTTKLSSLALDNTGVASGVYGDAANVARFAVNSQGIVSFASGVPIVIPAGSVTGLAPVATSGTYASLTGLPALGTLATQDASSVAVSGGTISGVTFISGNVTISGGTISGITDLAIADGGTGASTAGDARTNLGLAIGTNVQAYNSALANIATTASGGDLFFYTTSSGSVSSSSFSAAARSVVAAVTISGIRDALGLGDVSVLDDIIVASGNISPGAVITSAIEDAAITTAKIAEQAVTLNKLVPATTSNIILGRATASGGTIEEITCTAAARSILDDASVSDIRATLGLGTLATQNGTVSGTSSGDNTGDQTITLTGAVTGTGTGTFATTLAASAVTESAIATNAVTTDKVLDNAITADKLTDDSAAVVDAASPSGSGAFIGQQWINTNNGQEFTWTGTEWLQQAGIGTISIVDSTPVAIAVSYPDAYSAELTVTLETQAAASVFAGPASGVNTSPTFRAIVPTDLPDATISTKGIIQPGTGLSVATGTLNHTNTVSGSTVSNITFDNQGHITAALPLVAAHIPDLDTSKITTGEFATARYADASITASKLADYANAQIGETLPVADHIGQFFFNPIEGSVFLWDGNVWQPVGVTTGAIAFAGTFNAAAPSGIGRVGSVTAAGAAIGLVAGSGLPAASLENSEYYLVVASGGTITTGNAPFRTLAPPDLILSNGSAWVEVDVSTGAGAVAASNVSFTAGGDISAISVQTAIEEVSSECRNATNITSGTLAVARGGTGLASYAKGDLIAASGTTTLSKLTVGTNGHVLRANSATSTGLEWGADFTGTVTTVSSATAALTVATATTTPALTLRSATTSLNGIVQLSDSVSTTSSILAATPTAVKSAYDLAALALPKAGGTVTGDITLGVNIGIQFEGTTDDANEIRLIGADATADRTVTLPDATGTVALTSQLTDLLNVTGDLMTGALGIIAGTDAAPGLYFSGDTNTGIYSPAADTLAFVEGGVEAMRIDSSSRLIRGNTASINTVNLAGSTINPAVQQHAVDQGNATFAATNWQASSTAAYLVLGKSYGAAVGTHAAVPANALIGVVNFAVSDGTTFGSAAHIRADADALTSAGSTPGRLTFNTSAPGATSPTERMRIRSDGNIAIGGAGAAAVTLYNQGAITGSATSYGNFTQSTIQSDVTTTALGYTTGLGTAATAFTLAALHHFSAQQGAFGAGSTVTNQYGFVANSSLTGATNNFGFYGNIASATGRWNFYAAGTADNYFAGDVGIGTTSITEKLTVSGNIGLTGSLNFQTTSPASISATSGGNITISADSANTAASSVINFNIDGLELADFTSGGYLRFNRDDFAGAGICTQQSDNVLAFSGGANPLNDGLNIALSGPTRVSSIGYLMRWNTNQLYQWDKTSDFHAWSTGTGNERMRIRSDGNIGIGGTGSAAVTLYNQGAITGSTTAYGNFTNATIQSDVTASAFANRTAITTAAAAFTAVNLYHYAAGIGALGAASAVTNNIGFFAEGNLGSTSAAQVTTVNGFRSDIAAATGRWNFYAAGNAPNYFAGDVRTNTVVTARTGTPVNSNITATAAASSLLDGIRTGTPAANITLTLPTGTAMDAEFQELQTNQSFEWSLINLAGATFTITVLLNTGHTVAGNGNMVVAAATSGRFLTRKTAANTFTTYRIA
jgi:hypothetical protein